MRPAYRSLPSRRLPVPNAFITFSAPAAHVPLASIRNRTAILCMIDLFRSDETRVQVAAFPQVARAKCLHHLQRAGRPCAVGEYQKQNCDFVHDRSVHKCTAWAGEASFADVNSL